MSMYDYLEFLRTKLLDLTARNRLLKLKPTLGKTLQFANINLHQVWNTLLNRGATLEIKFIKEPPKSEYKVDPDSKRAIRPDAKDYARKIGIDTNFDLVSSLTEGEFLQSLLYPEDLERVCRKIAGNVKTDREDRGITNPLYLVFGILEFKENHPKENSYFAPLISIPVNIKQSGINRETGLPSYNVSYSGDEITDNITLFEKVKRNFGINIPKFLVKKESLNEEESETFNSPEDYFKAIEELIERKDGWQVRRQVTLAVMSFSKQRLYEDLDENIWKIGDSNPLTEGDLLKSILIPSVKLPGEDDAEEYLIDNHPKINLPLIYDADSYQHRALIEVLEGKSLVINGPPGTGKSQTITNLIANAINDGKKVLFVAEKLAALQVVKSRLSHAGLDKFVLELHGTNTNKKDFLNDIEDRQNTRFLKQIGVQEQLEKLQNRRTELQKYADVLNSSIANRLNLTVNQIIWKAEKHRNSCKSEFDNLKNISVLNATESKFDELDKLTRLVESLSRHYLEIERFNQNHVWWGFYPIDYKHEHAIQLEGLLKKIEQATNSLDVHESDLAKLLPPEVDIGDRYKQRQTLKTLQEIPALPSEIIKDLLPALFSVNYEHVVKVIQNIEKLIQQVNLLKPKIEKNLQNVAFIDDSVQTEATHSYELIDSLKLSDFSLIDLKNIISETNSSLKLLNEKGPVFSEAAAQAEIEYSANSDDLQTIISILKIAHEAPHDLLGFRKPEMSNPAASDVLIKAKAHLAECRELHDSLEKEYYMDSAPAESEIRETIQVFREGDAWYRIFQSDWRKARKVFRRFSRSKSKASPEQASKVLEVLLKLYRRREEFVSSSEYSLYFGALFLKEDTDFSKLDRLFKWYADSQKDLMANAVSAEIFNLDTVNPIKLAKLSKLYAKCSDIFHDVLSATKYLEDITYKLSIQKSILFLERLNLLKVKINELEMAVNFFNKYGYESLSPKAVFQAIRDFQTCRSSTNQLKDYLDAKVLLGDYFKGIDTDIESINATFKWGTSIQQLVEPNELSLRILQKDTEEYQKNLIQALNKINDDWEVIESSEISISEFGDYNSEEWYGCKTPISSQVRAKTSKALEALIHLLPWAQYLNARRAMVGEGLGEFVEKLESGLLSANNLKDGFLYRFYSTIVNAIFRERPELNKFSAKDHTEVRREFAELDKQIISTRGADLAYHIAQTAKPIAGKSGTSGNDTRCTEMGLLSLLFKQKKPRVPIRQIIRRAAKSIQEFKPCFMMSPISVAQFLVPNAIDFDLIVMDEASQITLEDAIGVVARGRQVVVVGDPKQLPPTRFFSITTDDDGDLEEEEPKPDYPESVLIACKGCFPERMLKFHYRSKHESLIAFSNAQFYNNKLVVFPSPYPKNKLLGLHYHYINGEYKNNLNHSEASRVADAVIDHMKRYPFDSLGVVTLNSQQKDLIDEILEKRLQLHPECLQFKAFHEEQGWPFFVKNLENVQGDERDTIYISTTFGKSSGTTVVRQSFGPISRNDGWRRLNVLFTRSRKSMHVFSSMLPEDVTASENSPDGTKALKGFLTYAKTGYIPNIIEETGREPDSDFEVAVADMLRERGFSVQPQLGVANYFIDMVVRNPERPSEYIVAIECDGASYHSGTAVRDRDRIRQEILESLGWKNKIWRIWSTDWFRNPVGQSEALIQFINQRIIEARNEVIEGHEITSETANLPENLDEEIVNSTFPITEESVEERERLDAFIGELASDDEEMYVQPGDKVTYIDLSKPHVKVTIELVDEGEKDDPTKGIVSITRPIGEALVEAQAGDEVDLVLDKYTSHKLKVINIERAQVNS